MTIRTLATLTLLVSVACLNKPSWVDDYPCADTEYAASTFENAEWTGFDCQPLPDVCTNGFGSVGCQNAICGEDVETWAYERWEVGDEPGQFMVDCGEVTD